MARLLSTFAQRRGYAAAAEALSPHAHAKPDDKAALAAALAMAQRLAGKQRVAPAHADPWVPDPRTGYYRPATGTVQQLGPEHQHLDAADLRALLLTPKH